MEDHDDSFFREVTSAICSSLEIASSLHRALLLLKRRMPLDLMIVWAYDEESGGLRKIAIANEEGGRDSNEIMQMHPATRKKLLGMDIPHTIVERTGFSPVVMRVVNQPSADPVAKSMKKYFLPQDYSSMVMYLDCEGKRVGTVFARAEGTNRYDSLNVRLLAMFEPFILAVATPCTGKRWSRKKELVGEKGCKPAEILLPCRRANHRK